MILETELPLSTAAAFLGVKPRTLQSWVQYMPTERVDGGGTQGSHRRFSFFAIMQAATAMKLIDLGITASRAFEIASQFSNFGGAERATWGGETAPSRSPSLPYHYALGETYLCADATKAAVVRVPKGSALDAEITGLDADTLIRVNVWPVYCAVVRALSDGDHKAPFNLLNEVYGIHSEADLKEYAG